MLFCESFIIDENSVLGEFAKMEISSTIGGYVVIRKIGEGGFGTVYLAKSRDGRLHALKEIHNPEKDSHEARSLKLYADALKDLAIEGIVPIEDIFQSGRKLCYAMPLADGTQNTPPEDGNWRPQTLDWVIEQRRKSKNWFSKDEILRIFIPIIDAVDALTARGLLHRDVKPANILFFNGKACLADIGLMAEDTPSVSSAGTPDYTPPQWYLQNHGHPDMWGLAATLFTLITGNHPDMMGRAAYFWPPHGKSRMSSDDIAAWEGFHRIIARATREKAKDRYLRIEDFRNDIELVKNGENIDEKQITVSNHTIPKKEENRTSSSILSIKGRVSRKRFLATMAVLFVLINYGGVMLSEIPGTGIAFLLLLNWPLIMIIIKRFHDFGWSTIWGISAYIASFIARITLLDFENLESLKFIATDIAIWGMLFLLAIPKGNPKPNKFGQPFQNITLF